MWIYKGNNHCKKKNYEFIKKKNLHFISHYLNLSQNHSINLALKVRESKLIFWWIRLTYRTQNFSLSYIMKVTMVHKPLDKGSACFKSWESMLYI